MDVNDASIIQQMVKGQVDSMRNELRSRVDKQFEYLDFKLRKYLCTCGTGLIGRHCPVHNSMTQQQLLSKEKELFDE